MFGGTGWGKLMAVFVIISGFGALNGWTMICAEMPLAAAKDGSVSRAVQADLEGGRPGVRDHRVDGARLDRDGDQLPRLRRRDRLHDARADDRYHRRHPVRLLRPRPDQVAARRPPAVASRRVRSRHRGGRRRRSCSRSCSSATPAIPATASGCTGRRSSWPVERCSLGIPVYLAQRENMTEPEPVPDYR